MAVLIIKNAMEQGIRCICPECNSELEYTYGDICRKEGSLSFSFFGPTHMVCYIVCPVCKLDIYIDELEKAKVEESVKEECE